MKMEKGKCHSHIRVRYITPNRKRLESYFLLPFYIHFLSHTPKIEFSSFNSVYYRHMLAKAAQNVACSITY